SGARTPVRLEVHSTNAAGRRTLGGTSTVFPGDVIEASLCNSSLEPYHYSVFYLSSNYAIEHVRSQSVAGRSPLEAFREIPVDRMKVADKRPVFGAQGYIVVATPQRQPRPELEFLDQSPLGVFTQTRATLAERPRSAFARFLLDAAKGKPATRGPSETTAPSLFSPVVSAASWTVARPPTKLE
ncbi:MAG TPA: hypothetical protein VGE52_13295, partial [Pirellulales bacterium]